MVPGSWEPAVLEGSFGEGYARLDDMDAIRLELKWNHLKGAVEADALRDRMLDRLARKGRGKGEFKAEPLGRLLPGSDASFFRWKAEAAAVGMVMRCADCERALLGQVLFPDGREDRAAALAVLRSLREHAEGDRAAWSIYRYRAEVDASWRLDSWKLAPGYLELCFQRGPTELLRLKRWGPAEVLLAGCDLAGWHARNLVGQYGRTTGAATHYVAGHEGLLVRRDRHHSALGKLVVRCSPPRAAWTHWNLRSAAWHCPESNRIYVSEHAAKRPRDRRDWRVCCHGDEGQT